MILNHLQKCFVHISFFYHTSFDSSHVNLPFPFSFTRVPFFLSEKRKNYEDIYKTCIFGIFPIKSKVVKQPSHLSGTNTSFIATLTQQGGVGFDRGWTCRGEDHHQANDLPASWGALGGRKLVDIYIYICLDYARKKHGTPTQIPTKTQAKKHIEGECEIQLNKFWHVFFWIS